jgi:hypothetical protein
VVAHCSRCGTGASNDDEGYSPVFDTAEDARRVLAEEYGWRIPAGRDGEQWLCRSCAEKDDCGRLGHVPVASPAATLEDGSLLGGMSWCDRCGTVLSCTPKTPPPPGYPAPEHRRADLYWNAAALPDGLAIAGAAATLIGALNAEAETARWDAWPGDQSRRPGRRPPAPADQRAAAELLITTARQLLSRTGDTR